MPKKRFHRPIEQFIIDIFTAIEGINRYMEPIHSSDDLINNESAFDVVCRRCEIIGEAMNHILDDQLLKPYVNPKWQKVVDFRNVVSHEYFGLNQDEIFRIAKVKVPELEAEMLSFIKMLPGTLYIDLALTDEQDSLRRKKRVQTVEYLDSIKRLLEQKDKS